MPLNGKTPKQEEKANLHGLYCHKDSKIGYISEDQLAKELEAWKLPLGEATLLQHVDDLLIATRNPGDCKDWTVSLKFSGTEWI